MRRFTLALLALAAGAGALYVAETRGWMRRRLAGQPAMPESYEDLEPLSFPPQPLERSEASHGHLLQALALAAPVAVALGAAALRQRHESGHWLH